jgi:mRNA interferase YafQ
VLSNPRHKDLARLLEQIATELANDTALSNKYRDHLLAGEYTHHRECHLKPDLLLIYKKPDESTLRLVRLGSHSELF